MKVYTTYLFKLTPGMFSAFAAFLDEGDEVIVMEPYFDQVLHLKFRMYS